MVHNPEATVTLQGGWDKEHRNLLAAPQVQVAMDKQVLRVGDTANIAVSVVNPNPNFTYRLTLVGGDSKNGPNANFSLRALGSGTW